MPLKPQSTPREVFLLDQPSNASYFVPVQSLKEQALRAISELPDSASLDDIIYRLFVIEKVLQGQAASEAGDVLTEDEVRAEMAQW